MRTLEAVASIEDEAAVSVSGPLYTCVAVRALGRSWTLRIGNPWDEKVNADGEITSSKFVPPRLGKDIADQLGIVRGPDGGLWFDAGGVYRPRADEIIEVAVRRVLGESFRRNHLAEVMTWCKTLPTEVTTDPPPAHLLNCANGVLDLDTLELRPVAWNERFTYQLPVRWNPEATCPNIEAFVRQVVPPDAVGLVTEVFGMCLLPTQRFRRAVMLLGGGSNGKSVLLSILRALLGPDSYSSVTLHALSEQRFASSQLFGKLANIAGDLDAKPVESSGAFKMLTGEDAVTAESKYGQPFQFVNYATLVFSANEWPVSYDQTDAYFTRWIAIPFDKRFVEGGVPLADGELRADPKLLDRLLTPDELEGLLVRSVAGARRLRDRGGFELPQSVRDAVTDYRQWADTVIAWADEAVTVKPDMQVPRTAVFSRYRGWCKRNGRSAVSSKKFWPRFRDVLKAKGIGFDEGKSHGDRNVTGLWIEGSEFE